MLNYEMPSLECAMFIENFNRKGFSFIDVEDIKLSISTAEFFTKIQDALDFNGKISEGTSECIATGHALYIQVWDRHSGSTIDIMGLLNPTHCQTLQNVIDEYTMESEDDGHYDIDVKHCVKGPHGLDMMDHELTTRDYEDLITDLYPSIKVGEMTDLYMKSNSSCLILTGAPGTGKTCFTKMMMSSMAFFKSRDQRVVYVKDPEILKMDQFWGWLTNHAPDALILDDLDDELTPRSEGENPIVNNILSFSDGIFPIKTKVIITTNLTSGSIDSALVRPGRCFDVLALPQLTHEEARNIWTDILNHNIDIFENCVDTSYDTISQAELMTGNEKALLGAISPYLRDESISIRKAIMDGEYARVRETKKS